MSKHKKCEYTDTVKYPRGRIDNLKEFHKGFYTRI